MLDQVVFTYKTYGIEETVTLSFDFDTAFDVKTDLGLDFDNASKTSVLDDFIGQYKDNTGNFLTVDKSGFTYNGEKIDIVQYIPPTSTEPAYFIGTWKGKTVSILKFSSKQILITSDDYSVNVTLDAVDPGVVTIDKKFIGVWKIDNEKENIHYTVRVQSHAVWVNDVECEIISCTQAEGATIKFGDDTLYLFDAAEDKEGKFVSAMIKYASNEYVKFTLLDTGESVGIEIPEEYVGMYMTDDERYKVVITFSTITINGIEFVPASYSEANGFVGTYGTDTEYRVAFYSVAGSVNKDVLQIGNGDKLNRVESLNKTISARGNPIPRSRHTTIQSYSPKLRSKSTISTTPSNTTKNTAMKWNLKATVSQPTFASSTMHTAIRAWLCTATAAQLSISTRKSQPKCPMQLSARGKAWTEQPQ